MSFTTRSLQHPVEKTRPRSGVNAWAGATPVLGGLCRPKPFGHPASALEVAPARALTHSSGKVTEKKELL